MPLQQPPDAELPHPDIGPSHPHRSLVPDYSMEAFNDSPIHPIGTIVPEGASDATQPANRSYHHDQGARDDTMAETVESNVHIEDTWRPHSPGEADFQFLAPQALVVPGSPVHDDQDAIRGIKQWEERCQHLPPNLFGQAIANCRDALARWKRSTNLNSRKNIQELKQSLHRAKGISFSIITTLSHLLQIPKVGGFGKYLGVPGSIGRSTLIWNEKKLFSLFTPADVQHILQIRSSITKVRDSFSWIHTSHALQMNNLHLRLITMFICLCLKLFGDSMFLQN
ncbi:unnamed protein product, partial [Thlaspi arvense]